MIFEREGCKPRSSPTVVIIRRELGKLRLYGPTSSAYASLTSPAGNYVQVGGSPAGMVLEKRDAATGRQYRAFQDAAVVPFPDGTRLAFSGMAIELAANEWFLLPQVVAVFEAFLEGRAEPDFVRWRDISALLNG
jgi:hypothetical protein